MIKINIGRSIMLLKKQWQDLEILRFLRTTNTSVPRYRLNNTYLDKIIPQKSMADNSETTKKSSRPLSIRSAHNAS